jgi:hypothetical protein
MKKMISTRALLFAAFSLATIHGSYGSASIPLTRADYSQAVLDVQNQIEDLQHQRAAQCPANYAKLFSGKTIKISLFSGYQNYDDEAADGMRARAMAINLQKPCPPGIEACGFSLVEKKPQIYRLQKNLDGKTVLLSIYSTSISDNNLEIMSSEKLREEQSEHSEIVKNRFYKELVNSDVVFYSGHSRYGAGLGFDTQDPIPTLFKIITRTPLTPILAALKQKPSRLKVLGLFSCQSEHYYRKDLESANPGLSLILTQLDVEDVEMEQLAVGALDALLSRKCDADFNRALIPDEFPTHRATYIRH